MVFRDFRIMWTRCNSMKPLLTNEQVPSIWKALFHRSRLLEVTSDLLSVTGSFKICKNNDTIFDWLFGIHPISCALEAKRRSIHAVFYRKDLLDRNARIKAIVEQCQEHNVEAKAVPRHKIDSFLPQRNDAPHQGVLAKVSKLNYIPVTCTNQFIEKMIEENQNSNQLWLLLNEIQDPMNFGSILRTSYFLGIHKVFVSSKNSCPLSPVVSKASSGAMEVMPIHSVTSVPNFCQILRSHNWDIVATESPTQSNTGDTISTPLSSYTRTISSLVILGNEGKGLPSELIEICSHKLFVESRQNLLEKNRVDSMNVSAAAAVILYHLLNSHS